MNHVLLGIRQRWAEMILARTKVVEIRRGRKRWEVGDCLWLYAVAPVQAVVGVALVSDVQTGSAGDIERSHRQAAALSEREYWRYARRAADLVTAVRCEMPIRLSEPRTLEELGVRSAPQSAFYLERRPVERLMADAAVQAQRAVFLSMSGQLRTFAKLDHPTKGGKT